MRVVIVGILLAILFALLILTFLGTQHFLRSSSSVGNEKIFTTPTTNFQDGANMTGGMLGVDEILNGSGSRELIRIQKLKPVQDELWFEERPNRFRSGSGANGNGSVAGHDSGHFRHNIATIWDPHPEYVFKAFGRKFHLKLSPSEDGFEAVHVTTHDGNSTRREPGRSNGCYYNGILLGDIHSIVAVSLCHGMTGHIRSSSGSFFIEPAEEWKGTNSGPMLHMIYQSPPNPHGLKDDYIEDEGSRRHQLIQLKPKAAEDPTQVGDSGEEDGKILQISSAPKGRVKRSMSRETYVELMVVTDSTMTAYHGGNLKHYVLTLLSIVSLVYKDGSIGNPVNIALVNFHVLQDTDFASKSNNKSSGISASEMLRNFCKWQKEMNDFDDSSVHHHDVALLLTRETICRNPWQSKCDTLGLAELGTMCDHYASCAIVQDNGLSAAFTIAHELGHVMNMPHDDDYKCSSFAANTKHAHYVMSRMLDQNTYPWAWSRCSRHFLTEFLDAGHGYCLEDKPPSNLLEKNPLLTNNQPGEIFSEHDQCQLVFGSSSKLCSYMPVCRRLWCTTGEETEGCRTQHMPWADGTPCGTERWCQRGVCVPRDLEKLRVVVGGWGPWQSYGECSRICGGGVRRSVRECDNPSPSNGGTYCLGPRVRYESCQTMECNSTDFRAEQCSKFNGDNFNIQGLPKDVQWVPKYSGISPKDRCKLFCRVLGSSAYYLLREKVVDGTPCGPDTFDICVNGGCLPAGCDRRLHSRKEMDVCGVCGGDGTTCKIVNGAYNESTYGYSNVIKIPAGATNLDVRQTGWQNSARDDNYLALLDPTTNEYILNGNFVVSMFRKTVHAAGTILEYSGSDSVMERINSSRPLKADLVIQVLSVGKLNPTDIRFQYVISHKTNYKWISHWTPCSLICKGTTSHKHVCVENGAVQVEDSKCSDKPQDIVRPCNDHCSLEWKCSCGKEKRVSCVAEYGLRNHTVVHEENCRSGRPKCLCPLPSPETKVSGWIFGSWSECSVPCGFGYMFRTVSCPYGNCQGAPPAKRKCNWVPCGEWRREEWTPCSRSCGTGVHRALVGCYVGDQLVPPDFCYNETKPILERECVLPPCYSWEVSQWSECYCPEGMRNRSIACKSGHVSDLVNERDCDDLGERPDGVKPCACPYRESDNEIEFQPKTSPLVWSEWMVGEWTECNGNNKRRRLVSCSAPKCIEDKPAEEEDCGIWWTGGWGRCNVTCGEGTETRPVRCIDKNRRELPEANCRGAPPDRNRPCASMRCEKRKRGFASWKTGPWGKCSNPCNGGVRLRQVVCSNNDCNIDAKPSNSEECNEKPCTWSVGPWSHCKVLAVSVCEKTRTVECINPNANQTKENETSEEIFSPENNICKPLEPLKAESCLCPVIKGRWIKGPWSQCTKKCGKGTRRRTISCLLNSTIVDENVCRRNKRPKEVKDCGSRCPFRWITSNWSECSKSCGYGLQTRVVNCHRVNKYGWVDPDPAIPPGEPGCENNEKPKSYNYCIISDCDSSYAWFIAPWSECDEGRRCGEEVRQRRKVYCHHKVTGQKVGGQHCKKESRPQRKRKCGPKPCGLHSCQQFNSSGEGKILVGGKNISIYCHPDGQGGFKEYVTLPAAEENFSEVYSKRLINSETCPNGGERTDTCDCVEDKHGRAGYTVFHKIRLNVTNLHVETEDFTFSTSIGSRIKYGHSGDCYSSIHCPQGKFSINLSGTGLKLDESVAWASQGVKAFMSITRSEDSTKVEGKCGGYCGSCSANAIKLMLP